LRVEGLERGEVLELFRAGRGLHFEGSIFENEEATPFDCVHDCGRGRSPPVVGLKGGGMDAVHQTT
jgi:hypothetical protein